MLLVYALPFPELKVFALSCGSMVASDFSYELSSHFIRGVSADKASKILSFFE